MLNPETIILPAIVAALRSNTALVALMGGDSARIYGYKYAYGVESRLEVAINSMKPPAVLIAWGGTLAGNFDGSEIWKHRFAVYIRIGNQATAVTPIGYGDIWAVIVNGAVTGGTNIRTIQLVSGLDIMDTPSVLPDLDEGRMDYFVGNFTFPEIGDN